MTDCKVDLGGLQTSALALSWQHKARFSASTAAQGWLFINVAALISQLQDQICLQLCRCDLLGQNIMGVFSASLCGLCSADRAALCMLAFWMRVSIKGLEEW